VICTPCKGSGVEPGSAPVKCEDCNGAGADWKNEPCKTCGGIGHVAIGCGTCRGVGYGKTTATENIIVPKGVFDGVTLKVKQKGNETLRGSVGDLLLKVTVEPSSYFQREGDNIVVKKRITMTQAILGDQIKVRTLQGMKEVTLPPGCDS
jgi:molecular chaperone DnaJ